MDFIKQKRFFYLSYLLLLGLALLLILSTDKIALHQFINSYMFHPADQIFVIGTFFGDGVFAAFLVVLLLFFNVRNAILLLASYGTSSICTQILKHLFFDDENRPSYVFEVLHLPLDTVKDLDLHIHNSFPSGHATTAFAIFTCLAFISKKTIAQLVFLALAVFISFTRVYLSQHFFEDIWAGSFVALLCTSLVFFIYRNQKINGILDKLNLPVFTLFKR